MSHALTPADPTYRQRLDEALRDCENEPIHRPGAIQPLGVLLALDRDLVVRQVSANAESLLGAPAQALLGRPFAELVGEDQAQDLARLEGLGDWRPAAVTALHLERGRRRVLHDAQVSRLDGGWLVEIEAQEHPWEDLFHALFVPIRDALWQLDAEADLHRYTQAVVDQVRLLTGYDRVMMYQFDSNWDGEVIAESKGDGMGSYLGNRFPASDIPAQARALYTRNLVRLIADVEARPVAVLSEAGSGPLDMGQSALRSFSPVHLEYLRNMGVRATLTISLLQNGRLWGLIACHHNTPKYIPLRVRELDEFIGKTVSLKLSNLETEARAGFQARVRRLLQDLSARIRATGDPVAVIRRFQPELLGLLRAGGAVIAVDGQHIRLGTTPTEADLAGLEARLRREPPAAVLHTEHLAALHPPAAAWHDCAGGLLLAPLDGRLRTYIAWLRPGLVRTVKWAGNPDKAVQERDGRLRISPRESFETWIETFRDHSPPWTQFEIDAANALALTVIEVLTQRALRLSETNYRLLAEYSTDLIARCDPQGVYTFVSPASAPLLGLAPDELVGRGVARLIAAEDRPAFAAALAGLTPAAPTATSLVRMTRPDGTQVWMECTLRRMEAPGGVEIVMNARDVTQRHTYQLAIEDLHRRNARILDVAMDGVIGLGPDGRIGYANERAAQLLGYDPDELAGRHCCELILGHTPADCPLLEAIRRNQGTQGSAISFGRRDGRPLPVEYVCTPMAEGPEGAAGTGCVLVFRERAAERQLDERLQATDAVIRQASEAVMITDPRGRIVSINPAFSAITGYAADEAVGQSPRLLKSGVHTPQFYDAMWADLRRLGYWRGEIWNRRKNGEIYPQWGSISAIADGRGGVRSYVAVFSDISKAKQAEDRMYFLANHDALTGLPNRVHFTERLGQALERCRREGRRLAVAFIDLDRFKLINDTLGHATGDRYLQGVAARIAGALRQQDLVSRWGGDEFVVYLDDIGGQGSAVEVVRRVIAAVRKPLLVETHELAPTISVGISLYPDDGTGADDLVAAADTAMYRAKERGRNGYELYTQHLAEETRKKFEVVSELRRALRNRELLLHYQPQVDGRTGRVVGLEALVRWDHPEHGRLPPGRFIPQAEELGLIPDVGEWVLQEACRQVAEWLRAGVPCPRVAVNIAPAQLKAPLVALVERTLADHCLAAAQLELEITEGALERGADVLPVLRALSDMGVSLSIDDFGTGYSSLAHLKDFPISCFKIDKSFIDAVPGSARDGAIVRTILALGASLEVEVVAEGVERPEQLEFLRSIGGCTVQGYLYSRPLPPGEVVEYLGKA